MKTVAWLVFFASIFGMVCWVLYGPKSARIRGSEEKARVMLAAMEADRYITSKVIKPALWKAYGDDKFVVEGMSSSFGARNVFNKIQKSYPDYHFKHACFDPRNRRNLADESEKEVLRHFSEDSSLKEWSGVLVVQGEERFAVAKPIYHETRCAKCHGNPADAPEEMVEVYGTEYGYGRKEGDLVGALVVSVPLELAVSTDIEALLQVIIGIALIAVPFLLGMSLRARFSASSDASHRG
jgi:hypothetical protein